MDHLAGDQSDQGMFLMGLDDLDILQGDAMNSDIAAHYEIFGLLGNIGTQTIQTVIQGLGFYRLEQVVAGVHSKSVDGKLGGSGQKDDAN